MANHLASSGAPALLASDLIIQITPRAHTEYQGTAEQLRAEGLIPDGFKWPTGTSRISCEVGKFSYWVGRKRPEGHKGPMSSWAGVDNWFLRRGLTSQERDGWRAADIYEKSMALAEVIRRGTPEYNRISNASWKARCDDKHQAFRSLVIPEPKRGRGRPSKTTTTQTQGASA
jgi:hypothetical protein